LDQATARITRRITCRPANFHPDHRSYATKLPQNVVLLFPTLTHQLAIRYSVNVSLSHQPMPKVRSLSDDEWGDATIKDGYLVSWLSHQRANTNIPKVEIKETREWRLPSRLKYKCCAVEGRESFVTVAFEPRSCIARTPSSDSTRESLQGHSGSSLHLPAPSQQQSVMLCSARHLSVSSHSPDRRLEPAPHTKLLRRI
jgi:hypothetical protein